MTDTDIDGTKITGVLRPTWLTDNLAHILEHSETDEPSGTWTGLACPDHGLALGTDVDTATLGHKQIQRWNLPEGRAISKHPWGAKRVLWMPDCAAPPEAGGVLGTAVLNRPISR